MIRRVIPLLASALVCFAATAQAFSFSHSGPARLAPRHAAVANGKGRGRRGTPVLALRAQEPLLRHPAWFASGPGDASIAWYAPSGHEMTPHDWHDALAMGEVFPIEQLWQER